MPMKYESRDVETPIQVSLDDSIEHGIVVSNLAYNVGKELGLDEAVCYDLAVAGLLHDNGKVRLNFYMNEKEEQILAVDETRYLRMHSTIGHSILVEHGYDNIVLDAVLYHHEHYDGTGYPSNLKRDEIPLVGRIMHVCDIFGALIANRDYREGFSVETALEVMIEEVKNFDMKVFLAFQRVAFSKEMLRILEKSNLHDTDTIKGGTANDNTSTERDEGLVRGGDAETDISGECVQRPV